MKRWHLHQPNPDLIRATRLLFSSSVSFIHHPSSRTTYALPRAGIQKVFRVASEEAMAQRRVRETQVVVRSLLDPEELLRTHVAR
jgi:hypothetical protein